MENIDVTIPVWNTNDMRIFTTVVNQGIDSRLEGFTKSTFGRHGDRLCLSFHPDEFSILIRRLYEMEEFEATQWADDIAFELYGDIFYMEG